ncbi:PREDICTED: MMS19 nucleotide excision repair protein homolog isoform X1 [Camelina sativa]|uniref:MMS19 nucleotide excision repair protein n=1 Tax=Camelina sativa TaxID=90675 RepID=A0ABM0UCY6_CAMSA|nr:PREDICTED: MMS19 nucleotide excision repair protein homolog isoform X1 [Camelina sativa]
MVETNQLTQYLETFVDITRSPTEQDDSRKAIASSLDNDSLSINQLVREMELYLTTTDNVVRARGILLLAEVLDSLKAKPLTNAIVHTLVGFFSEKLADWRALRGALVGCLALMKRKDVAGVVTHIDAQAMAKSMLQNVQLQALAPHDRKLGFELLEFLLQQYSEAMSTMGNLLVYATCEAIDGEKDPQCLIVAFHLIELLAQLFPSPSGPLASDASDLFEVFGCYFPLHFTHTKDDETNIRREDLARGLSLAISSTPLFEPYAIPLLLEKLSSSLPIAKVDSLKCLKDCAMKYGVDRMKKHYGALWSALKDTFYSSTGTHLSFALESITSPGFEINEIHNEAVSLLQRLVEQDISFLGFVVEDIRINTVFDTISRYSQFRGMPDTSKLEVLVISQILSVSAKASVQSCNIIFQTFFFRLMNTLGIVEKTSNGDVVQNGNFTVSTRLYHGGLHLCIELLAASKDLTLGFEECSPTPDCAQESWCSMVKRFSVPLIQVFASAVYSSSDDSVADVYLGVKGLLTMGMFWGGSSPVSRSEFEKILVTLTSIITSKSGKTMVWELALKALVWIGSFIDRYHETDKARSYMSIVVDKLVSLACSGHCGLPYPMMLEATSEVCSTGSKYVEKMVLGLEEAFCSSLSDFYVNGNFKSVDKCSHLLGCLTNKLLPRVAEIDGLEKLLVHFAISMWNQIESCGVFSCDFNGGQEFVEAAITIMGQIVGIALVDSQNSIIQKAYRVVLSSTLAAMESIPLTFVALEDLQRDLSTRDELILSLFASIIIAASPAASIPDARSLIHLFLVSLHKGYIPAAQALGSMVNKLGRGTGGTYITSGCSLEEACDIIFQADFASGEKISSNGSGKIICGSETTLSKICLGFCGSLEHQTHAITGLAWIGKGLLMRGDERVNEIALVLVECLKSTNCSGHALHPSAMKHAADAFSILMSDSEVCLNRKFHAVIRPLYKQRFFSKIVPILESLIMNFQTPLSRKMLHVALAHVISNVPVTVILDNTKKLQPMILEGLSVLSIDSVEKETLFSLLLVLSGTLTDTKGQQSAEDNAHIIIECLVKLTSYPNLMVVRETAIQCLLALLELPHRRIYPFRIQVLQAIAKSLDDPKRRVRGEAIKCRQAWASITSTNIPF